MSDEYYYPSDDLWQQEQLEWERAYFSSVYNPIKAKDYIIRFEYVLRGTPCIIEVTKVDYGHPRYQSKPFIDYRILDIFNNIDEELTLSVDLMEDERIESVIMLKISKEFKI